MTNSHGKQVCVDYSHCDFNEVRDGSWMLELMRYAVNSAKVREVHSHVEEFDGSKSPAGFAAVVLLDESHVSAHCYYCLLYTSPSPRDRQKSRMPSSA